MKSSNLNPSLSQTPALVRELCEASKEGNVWRVKELLTKQDLDINHADDKGWNALSRSCFRGHLEIVQLLASDKRINVNEEDENGNTGFLFACQEGRLDVVKFLLKDERVDVTKGNNQGSTPFFFACQNGHLEVVKLLIKDERIDINQPSSDQRTPIVQAYHKGYLDVIKWILVSGREVNVTEYLKQINSQLDFLEIENNDDDNARKQKCGSQIIALLEEYELNSSKLLNSLKRELGLIGNQILLTFIYFFILKKII